MGVHIKGKNILLGVTGSIAAYKAATLLRLLKKADADVQALMTPDAARFIPPLTLSTLSGKETLIDIFPEGDSGVWTKHINLGLWGNVFVIAPATAQTIAKLAHGFCDSMLTAVALAARCPIMVFPAMDHDMYVHPATVTVHTICFVFLALSLEASPSRTFSTNMFALMALLCRK